jgi:predicted kinase
MMWLMSNAQKIIIVCGLPGTGKSTLAEGITRELKVPVFSVDPIESALLKSGINKSIETGLAAYLVAEKLADEQLQLGMSVVLDSVSAAEEAKRMWRALASKHKVELVIIECICSDSNLHKSRIEQRVRVLHGIPEVTWEDVLERKTEYIQWVEQHEILDGVNNAQDNLRHAIQYIAEHDGSSIAQ